MKKLILVIIVTVLYLSLSAKASCKYPVFFQDTTLHLRFVMNILQEYEMEGRWLFVKIDSVGKLKNNYELIHPKTIFDAYTDGFHNVDRKMFLFNAYETFRQHEPTIFERYPDGTHPIKGIKVNMEQYNALLKISKDKLLSIYFEADKTLKNEYNKWLYEIIAVCYVNNIKVITPSNSYAYYEVFQ